jgi:acyl carrier protein
VVSTRESLDRNRAITEVVAILEDMTRDWELEYSGEIGAGTRLMGDLSAESIDIVMLIVAIEERFHQPGLPFEELLMHEGRYVDDLTVEEIADFLVRVIR